MLCGSCNGPLTEDGTCPTCDILEVAECTFCGSSSVSTEGVCSVCGTSASAPVAALTAEPVAPLRSWGVQAPGDTESAVPAIRTWGEAEGEPAKRSGGFLKRLLSRMPRISSAVAINLLVLVPIAAVITGISTAAVATPSLLSEAEEAFNEATGGGSGDYTPEFRAEFIENCRAMPGIDPNCDCAYGELLHNHPYGDARKYNNALVDQQLPIGLTKILTVCAVERAFG
jgi:hypothetical protein